MSSEGKETVGTARTLDAHLDGTSTMHTSSWAFSMSGPDISYTVPSGHLYNLIDQLCL